MLNKLLLLLFLAGCSTTGNDCNFKTNVYGTRISWKNRTPVLHIDSTVPFEFKQIIKQVVYRLAPYKYVTLIDVDVELPTERDTLNVIKFANYTLIKDKPTYAITYTTSQDSLFIDGDIVIDYKNYNYNSDEVDFETIFLHEYLHFLGLKHLSDKNAVLYPKVAPGERRRELSFVEQQSLLCEYNK